VEEFFSIQGEGFFSGKAAWFIRLGGCDIGCRWCDSRFTWDPGLFPAVETDRIIEHAIKSGSDSVVITGGEPLLWNLDHLCSELRKNKIRTFLETSGAHPMSGMWDWICLSPKQNMPPLAENYPLANELKVIIQSKTDFIWAENSRKLAGKKCKLYLQPEWRQFEQIIPEIVEYVKQNNMWSISLQIHKYMHIP
jgi:organic radical activating enzyme